MNKINFFSKHPFFSFLMVFGISFLLTYMLIGAVLVALLGLDNAQAILSGTDNDSGVIVFQKFLQCAMVIGVMIIPSLFYSYLVYNNTQSTIGVKIPSLDKWLISIALMVVAMPAVAWLTNLNEAMQLPAFLQGIEMKMRQMEELAKQQTLAFLKMESFGDLLFNIVMIGLFAAVGEELVFRGVIQKSLLIYLKKPWASILIASFIFSFIHFQFFGFLPRFFLGVILGFTYYISGSIWVCMLLHFLNNAIQVIMYYAFLQKNIDINIDETPQVPLWIGLLSLAMCISFMLWYVNKNKVQFMESNTKNDSLS